MKLFELIFDDDDNDAIGLYGVSLVNSPAIGIEAIQLSDEQPFLSAEIVDTLKKIGKTPLKYSKDYRLMRVESIEDDTDLTSLNFASEDNKHFSIRYRYSGKLNHNSRTFCKTLVSFNQEFTKDEVALFDDLNPSFAPKGKSEYSVLKFKGGVNCKHYWERLIYWNEKDSAITYDEALKQMPKNLVKQISKLPKEVGEVANASNNFWRLKYSDEKKRMLTQPLLIANQRIYRQNIKGFEAEVFATAQTVEKLAKNFFKKNYHHNSSIEHDEEIEGFFIWESWIVQDPKNDKSNAMGFENLPKGTWMCTAQLSQQLWDDYIRTGEVKGLSIDALLDVIEVDNQKIKLKNENQKMLTKDFLNKIKSDSKSKVKSKAKLKFSDEMTLVDSELQYSFVGTEPVGATLVDGEGNAIADFKFAYDGVDYITNESGVIDLFVEAEETAETVELSDEEMNEIVDEISDIVAEVVAEEVTDKDAIIAELQAKIAELEAKFETAVEEVVELKKQTPAKPIGFSKQVVEPKNESYLDLTKRLRK